MSTENNTTESPSFDWTKVGRETISENERGLVLAAIEAIDNKIEARAQFNEWLPIVGTRLTLSFMAGEGIKTTIQELRLPNVSHVAVSHSLAPLSLYGIRAHYAPTRRQRVDVFVIDLGDQIRPVVMRVWPLADAPLVPPIARVNTEPSKPIVTCEKVAWVRDPNAPEGQPASGRLRCPCGNAPVTQLTAAQGDITCNCGALYTWDGYVKKGGA